MPIPIKVGNEDFEEVPKTAVVASKVVSDMWVRLGKPQTPFSTSGAKMMEIIIAVWQDCYPLDAKVWSDQRHEYKANELSIKDQVQRHTGRSLASYPYPIFKMMKSVFRGFDPAERKNCMKMVKKWPMFMFANKA